MSQRKRRASMLSLLDILCNGMGACLLLFLILGATEDVQLAGATPSKTVIFYLAHFDPTDTLMLRVRVGEGDDARFEFVPLGNRLKKNAKKAEGGKQPKPFNPCNQNNRNAPKRFDPIIKGIVWVLEYSCEPTGTFDAESELKQKGTFHSERLINVSVPPNTPVRWSLSLAQHGDDGASSWRPDDTKTFWKHQVGEKWQEFPDPIGVGLFTKEICLINKGTKVELCQLASPISVSPSKP